MVTRCIFSCFIEKELRAVFYWNKMIFLLRNIKIWFFNFCLLISSLVFSYLLWKKKESVENVVRKSEEFNFEKEREGRNSISRSFLGERWIRFIHTHTHTDCNLDKKNPIFALCPWGKSVFIVPESKITPTEIQNLLHHIWALVSLPWRTTTRGTKKQICMSIFFHIFFATKFFSDFYFGKY